MTTVKFNVKRLSETNEYKVTVCVNGIYNEDRAYYTDDKLDALVTKQNMKMEAIAKGETVLC